MANTAYCIILVGLFFFLVQKQVNLLHKFLRGNPTAGKEKESYNIKFAQQVSYPLYSGWLCSSQDEVQYVDVVKNLLHVHMALRKDQGALSRDWISTAKLVHLLSNYVWFHSSTWQMPKERSCIRGFLSLGTIKSFTVRKLGQI